MRASDTTLAERWRAAMKALVLRIRALQHAAYERSAARNELRWAKGEQEARLEPGWRDDLVNVADLDLAFTRPLWRLKPDIIHIHDIHLLEAGVMAARRLRARGQPVRLVYDAHEFIGGMSAATPRLAAAWQDMERELIEEVDAVITVSDPIADAIQERFGLLERPTVTLNTPTLTDQRTAPSDVRAACGLPAATTLLVYSGVLNAKRGVITAIRGLVHLPDVHLAVVCVPNAHFPGAEVLQDYAATIGAADRLHLVEPVPSQEIIDFISTADIGVHPLIGGLLNHEMALPNKLFDYVYAGLPVVVSDVRLMGEFVRSHNLGATFTPQDAEDFARAVLRVVSDIDTFRTGAANPELRTELSWEAQATRIADLYASFDTGGA